jgi:hypothetical protein
MIDLIHFLLRRKRVDNLLGMVEFPSMCGYQALHREYEDAKRCIFKSRNAFIALGTICTFAIMLNFQPGDVTAAQPSWIKVCNDEQGVNIGWLNNLRDSFVCDFTPGFRPGAYVNAWQTRWASVFPVFLETKIPLWIWWGPNNDLSVVDTDIMKYQPSSSDMLVAKSNYDLHRPKIVCIQADHPPSLSPFHSLSHNDGDNSAMEDFSLGPSSPHDEHSASLGSLGELRSHEEYDSPLEALRGSLSNEQMADLVECQSRAQELIKDSSSSAPDFGSAMYEWRYTDRFVPTLLDKKNWDAKWAIYPPQARTYDVLTNTWTLLPHKAAMAALYDDASQVVSNSNILERSSSAAGPTPFGSTPTGPVIGRFSLPPPSPHPSPLTPLVIDWTRLIPDPVDSTLANRYGFDIHDPYATPLPMQQNKYEDYSYDSKRKTSDKANFAINAMTSLGMRTLFKSTPPTTSKAALEFFNFVVASKSHPHVFNPEWDFTEELRDGICKNPRFSVSHHGDSEDAFYLIGLQCHEERKELKEQWFLLSIRDSVSVVQLFRERCTGILNMTRRLLELGIPFSTPFFSPHEIKKPIQSIVTASWIWERSDGYKFTLDDFEEYENKKKGALSHPETARAALMYGGIVWRLALVFADTRSVTNGPRKIGRHHLISLPWQDGFLCDQQLTEIEADAICGSYVVKQNSGM